MLFIDEKKHIISTFYCIIIDIKFSINAKTKPGLSMSKKHFEKKLKMTPPMKMSRQTEDKNKMGDYFFKNGLNVAEYGNIYVE